MKNIVLKSLVASSLLCSSLFAGNVFVGVNGGYSLSSKMKIEPNDADVSLNFKDKRANLGFKVGYDFGEFKAYGAYRYKTKASDSTGKNSEIKWSGSDFLVGGDYTPKIANNFKLDLGIYAGSSLLKLDLNNVENLDKYSAGLIYGAKIGAIFEIDMNNEVEFGYQIDKTTYKDVKIVDEKFKIDITDHGLYLGYNYKF